MRRPRLHARVILLLAGASTLGVACHRGERSQGGSAAASASSAAQVAPATVSPAEFCAFMERLMLAQMAKKDELGLLSKETREANAKKLNEGCVEAIGKVAAKDPAAWQGCSRCLVDKPSFEQLKDCDAVCKTVGLGGARAASSK